MCGTHSLFLFPGKLSLPSLADQPPLSYLCTHGRIRANASCYSRGTEYYNNCVFIRKVLLAMRVIGRASIVSPEGKRSSFFFLHIIFFFDFLGRSSDLTTAFYQLSAIEYYRNVLPWSLFEADVTRVWGIVDLLSRFLAIISSRMACCS